MIPDGLWTTEQGSPTDPVVVLVHGSMDRSPSFAKVAARLDGFLVVRYDRRGYGRSRALGPGSVVEHAADLVAVIGERSAVVVGHSLGGLVALAAAATTPGIAGVGSFEAPLPWTDWWSDGSAGAVALASGESPEGVAETFMRRMMGDLRWERLPAATRDERRSEGPALVADLVSARSARPFDPAAITCPVLVGYGSATGDRHRRGVVELGALLGTPPPFVIDDATHGAHRSHAAAFAEFVTSVAAAGE